MPYRWAQRKAWGSLLCYEPSMWGYQGQGCCCCMTDGAMSHQVGCPATGTAIDIQCLDMLHLPYCHEDNGSAAFVVVAAGSVAARTTAALAVLVSQPASQPAHQAAPTCVSPTHTPMAARKVKAILPPTTTMSALAIMAHSTPILSATLAPPMTTHSGRWGLSMASPAAEHSRQAAFTLS